MAAEIARTRGRRPVAPIPLTVLTGFLGAGKTSLLNRLLDDPALADPAPVLHTLMMHPYLVMRLRLDGVVTVVDAVNGLATLDQHPESVKQAAVADRIALTKTDLLDTPQRRAAKARLLARLRALNPAAPILDVAANEATADRLLDCGLYDPARKIPDVGRWLAAEAYAATAPADAGHAHDPNRHDDRIRAFCVASEVAIPAATFDIDRK